MGVVPRLTQEDLRRFAIDGYLVVRDVVPESLLTAADAEIDQLIQHVEPTEGDRGAGPNLWFAARRRLSLCDAVLRDSPVLRIAEDLVAPNRLHVGFDQIQVATTVPPYWHIPGGPHIDGHGP